MGMGEVVTAQYVDFFLAQWSLHGVLESCEQDVISMIGISALLLESELKLLPDDSKPESESSIPALAPAPMSVSLPLAPLPLALALAPPLLPPVQPQHCGTHGV